MNKNQDTTVDTTKYNKRLMNNVVRLPLEISSAAGCSLFNKENENNGRPDDGWLLDFWGDEGVCSLGYNTPELFNAMAKFSSGANPHQLPDIYPHKSRWEAAEKICSRTDMDRIFFANSGTEANEAAIKIARKHWYDRGSTDRYIILTLEGNFHGRTGLSLAAGDYRVSPYHRVGFGPRAEGFGVLNDDFRLVVMDEREFEESRVPPWDRVAAIIMAPVLGNNLVKTYSKEFWSGLASIREEHGVLLIYDDVQAGSGRAGYFATYQHPDIQVKPDIMTLAKGMAMGFPMSCMMASEKISESFTPGVHFNTFGGSPFVCHMASCLYDWLDKNIEEVREKGHRIREHFKNAQWIKEHDGAGLLNAFTPDFENHGYDGFQFVHMARQTGLLLATHRKHGPIRFTPPLNIGWDYIDLALIALDTTHARLVSNI